MRIYCQNKITTYKHKQLKHSKSSNILIKNSPMIRPNLSRAAPIRNEDMSIDNIVEEELLQFELNGNQEDNVRHVDKIDLIMNKVVPLIPNIHDYKCDSCDMSFSKIEDLNNHINIHLKERVSLKPWQINNVEYSVQETPKDGEKNFM